MKTVIITVIFMLLFTGARTYRTKEIEVLKREHEIEQKIIIFDSLYKEGLRLERKIDVIESEINKIKKNKYYEKQWRRLRLREIRNEKL